MKYKKEKYAILSQNEELELTQNGDFIIKKDLVENYEIIDFHCHSFEGLCQLFPPFLQKKKTDYNKSLMDLSCFPFSMNLFDLNKVYFSDCPTKLFSLDGLKTKIKLFTGALVLNYATTEKLLIDMNNNVISKAVIQQINPPDKNSADIIEEIVNKNVLSTNIPSKQTKKDVQNQRLDKYEIVLDTFPDTTFILAHSTYKNSHRENRC